MDVISRVVNFNKLSGRPPFEGMYAYLLAALVGYGVADMAILKLRPHMLSKKPPTSKPAPLGRTAAMKTKSYEGVYRRNMFNSKGFDPQKLSADGKKNNDSPAAIQQVAVKTQLPLSLEGTIVHANPAKSVATIVAKNSNESKAYQIGDGIKNLIDRITSISRRRVEFLNKQSGRLEFVEIPIDEKLTLNFKGPAKPSEGGDEVVKRGQFDFELNRGDVKKYLSDLSGVLSQARMQPNLTGPGGEVDGFKFTGIQPGSIYEKLGFKVQDVIKAVNGEPVNSPTKAMELYNALKGQNYIEIDVERNGRQENFTYNINE